MTTTIEASETTAENLNEVNRERFDGRGDLEGVLTALIYNYVSERGDEFDTTLAGEVRYNG